MSVRFSDSSSCAAIRLELLESLDGLAGAGKHTEDVEADLQSR